MWSLSGDKHGHAVHSAGQEKIFNLQWGSDLIWKGSPPECAHLVARRRHYHRSSSNCIIIPRDTRVVLHLNLITFNFQKKRQQKKQKTKVFEFHEQYGKSYYTLLSSLEVVLHNFPFVLKLWIDNGLYNCENLQFRGLHGIITMHNAGSRARGSAAAVTRKAAQVETQRKIHLTEPRGVGGSRRRSGGIRKSAARLFIPRVFSALRPSRLGEDCFRGKPAVRKERLAA